MIGRTLFALLALGSGLVLAMRPAQAGGTQASTPPKSSGTVAPTKAATPKQTAPANAALQTAPKKAQAPQPKQPLPEQSGAVQVPIVGSAAAWGVVHLRVFTFKHALAQDFARIVVEVLGAPGRVINAIPDPRTNSVIVTADPDLIVIVEALAGRLDVPVGWPRERK